jgi:hypothetical protein
MAKIKAKDLTTPFEKMDNEQLQRGIAAWYAGSSGGRDIVAGDAASALAATEAQERASAKAAKKAAKKAPADGTKS